MERNKELAKPRAYIQGDIRKRMEHYAPPGNPDECWPWTGARARGHGAVWHNGKQRGAHVVAWELASGRDVPEDMVVRHKCDFGACVNPNHLEIGTQQQNVMDMIERGRYVQPAGFRHRTSRERAQIVALYREGVRKSVLARIFGCTHQTISNVIKKAESAQAVSAS